MAKYATEQRFELAEQLVRRVEDARTKRWQDENRQVIEARNRFVEEHGLWGEKYRQW